MARTTAKMLNIIFEQNANKNHSNNHLTPPGQCWPQAGVGEDMEEGNLVPLEGTQEDDVAQQVHALVPTQGKPTR